MGIDVRVGPVAMDWAGLDQASLDILTDLASYLPIGAQRERGGPEIRWEARPAYPEDLTLAMCTAAVSAVEQFRGALEKLAGTPVAWVEVLPDPNDVDAWEETEGFIGQLSPAGLGEMRGIAAALSSGVVPDSLEQLINASSDELVDRTWREGGGAYPNVLSIGIDSIFVPARLPHPFVGPTHLVGSCAGLDTEVRWLAEAAFGMTLEQLVDDPPLGGGLGDSIVSNLLVFAEAFEAAEERGLPLIVSG